MDCRASVAISYALLLSVRGSVEAHRAAQSKDRSSVTDSQRALGHDEPPHNFVTVVAMAR